MEKDFHFYCIAVLARATGFNSGDALRIAYASQYVDDSTESEPLMIQVDGNVLSLDPVMTSHAVLDTKNLVWSDQKRVWIPFHFLPPKPLNLKKPEIPFEYVTQKDSQFSQLLLKEAHKGRDKHEILIKLGIALHTFADCWSHAGFTGKGDDRNDVEMGSLEFFDIASGDWKSEPLLELAIDLSPKVGHGQCGHYPDIPYLRWRYKQSGETYERDNWEYCMDAANKIYHSLYALRNRFKRYSDDPLPGQNNKTIIAWEELGQMILPLFSDSQDSKPTLGNDSVDLQRRCQKWEITFSHLFETRHNNLWMDEDHEMENSRPALHYNAQDCRRDIFIGDLEWKSYQDYKGKHFKVKKQTLGEFTNSFWVKFHRAALQQRHFVLENIP